MMTVCGLSHLCGVLLSDDPSDNTGQITKSMRIGHQFIIKAVREPKTLTQFQFSLLLSME